jgi:hypothetical protein
VLSILFDENVNRRIIRGLESRLPDLDSVTAQQIGLGGRPDSEILEWAAANRRILVTHDLRTMPRHAGERVRAGQEMPGVFGVPKRLPIGQANRRSCRAPGMQSGERVGKPCRVIADRMRTNVQWVLALSAEQTVSAIEYPDGSPVSGDGSTPAYHAGGAHAAGNGHGSWARADGRRPSTDHSRRSTHHSSLIITHHSSLTTSSRRREDSCSCAKRTPADVSQYMCRGGLPASTVSQDDSNSVVRPNENWDTRCRTSTLLCG